MDQTRELGADTHQCSHKPSSTAGITERAEDALRFKSGEEWTSDCPTSSTVPTAESMEKTVAWSQWRFEPVIELRL
ncbi:hypothetical protein NDU88_001299 [Pleurodeles waltl]|uniref:Uncharacterized protein n=1 Tax=Pleurodeles waltl TaxID=8319 RepID=A0AAV7THW9_PLEWA|nr:hypothetical protein NDU88_001299 [Pleurodeles waltl]